MEAAVERAVVGVVEVWRRTLTISKGWPGLVGGMVSYDGLCLLLVLCVAAVDGDSASNVTNVLGVMASAYPGLKARPLHSH